MLQARGYKRFWSLILALSIIVSTIPYGGTASAAVQKLTIRNVYQNFKRSEKILTIEDERIKNYRDKQLSLETADAGWKQINNISTFGSQIVQVTLEKSWNIKTAMLSGTVTTGDPPVDEEQTTQYTGINENEIPEITSMETPLVGVNEDLIANGPDTLEHLTDSSTYSVQVGSVDAVVSAVAGSGGKQIKLAPRPGSQFAQGKQDIVVTRINSDNGYTLENIFIYKAAVQIVGEINLDGMTMFPSMGEAGSEVQFKRSTLNNYDIYFIKSLDNMSLFNSTNRVPDKDFQWVSNPGDEEDVITVKVPNLEPGPYYVVFTNTNSLTDGITARYTYTGQQYTIIKLSQQPTIVSVQPASAPSQTPTELTISGYFFAPHNISGFVPDAGLNSASYSNGKINYGAGTLKVGSTDYRVKVTREFEIIVGSYLPLPYNFTFDPDKPSALNEFKVSTIALNLEKKETHDVMVRMKTTIEPETATTTPAFSGSIVKEVIKDDAFVYEPATETPELTEVVPSVIPIEEDGAGYCLNNTLGELLVAIKGDKFLVTRYMDGNDEVISYPKVTLGGVTINNNRDIAAGQYKPVSMQVYNDDVLVDGTEGNQLGDTIIIILKAGPKSAGGFPVVSKDSRNVQIQNPIRKSSEFSVIYNFDESVSFSLVDKNDFPVIKSVIPDLVATDGGDEVVISGSNLRSGAQVYIGGNLVSGVTIKGDNSEITFKAPPGKSGVTQLQVVNPDGGGIATHDFTYTVTYTEPELSSLNPPEGTANTLLTLKGRNFLRSDPTVQVDDPTNMDEFLIFRLIGSRVLMAGYDVNNYNLSNNRIQLKKYVQGENGYNLRAPILSAGSGGTVLLNPGYDGIILRDESADSFYVITRDIRNNLAIEDGLGAVYNLSSTGDGQIEAVFNGASYTVDQTTKGKLVLKNGTSVFLELSAYTPYYVEAVKDGEVTYHDITGNRVHFIDSETLQVNVPPLVNAPWTGDGLYDVTVINPDTRKSTLKEAFRYYSIGRIIPVVTDIIPDQGPDQGGNIVTISGPQDSDEKTAFADQGEKKTRVFIGVQEVPAKDVTISADGQQISLKMPAYNESIKDKGTDRVTVPIVLVNPDGGSFSISYNNPLTVTRTTGNKDITGYTYVVPSSNPKINTDNGISPAQGSANGGYIVDIFGSDFRDFEPFSDLNGNGKWDEGEAFTDLDNNGEYTDKAAQDKVRSSYNSQYMVLTSPLLPRVFFGIREAEIVEYNSGYLQVVVPPGTGAVKVYVVNNDSGISNQVTFTYIVSKPAIKSIQPSVGKKQGGEQVEIQGSDFENSQVIVLQRELDDQGMSTEEKITMPLVKVGDRTNRNLARDDENSGRIQSFRATVTLAGNLTVNYDSSTNKVTVSLQNGEQIYRHEYGWKGAKKVFIDSTDLSLTTDATVYYPYQELISLEISDNRLIVDGGYAPQATLSEDKLIKVTTPAYYTVGQVKLYVINPDGGQASGIFTYKNPDSHPQITNITRDESSPDEDTVNGIEMKILRVNYKGNSEISIFGSDFRSDAQIQIGDAVTVKPEQIEYELPGKMTFTMPQVDESYAIDQGAVAVDKLLRVMVINTDGGSAKSDELVPPIYILFTKGETQPAITSITPAMGPGSGGTVVTITGTDFRSSVEGYSGKSLSVYFGEKKASNIKVIDSTTITVVTPGNNPGTTPVRVENPDGEISNADMFFTYISAPVISSVVDFTDVNSRLDTISTEGGQKIKIKGSGFMEGARVIFYPASEAAEGSSSSDIFYWVGSEISNGQSSMVLDPQALTGGVEGSEVTFIDAGTIAVITPAGKEDSTGIMVINPDKGASDVFKNITYGLPELSAPQGVTAVLVKDASGDSDLFIKVNWKALQGATAYEVYAVVDGQSEFVASTRSTSLVYKNLQPDTTYKFKVTAIGNYGSSPPSAESNEVTTGSEVGPEDKDGNITKNYEESKVGNTAIVKIGTRDFDDKIIKIDLTRDTLAGAKELVIILPARVISSSKAKDIEINGLDFGMSFNPNAFKTDRINDNRDKEEAGVKFTISPYRGGSGQQAANSLSATYLLSAQAYFGQETVNIDYLKENMQLTIDYDGVKADMRRFTSVALHRYSELPQKWETTYEWEIAGGSGMVTINRLGRYTVMGLRR